MASPGDGTVLSSSPGSMRGASPVRRRANSSVSDGFEANTRPRLSPTLMRSYDLNDPDVRERQRTMDVDMAMQLSRARRDTISPPEVVSPYEPHPHLQLQPEPNFNSLSYREEQDLNIARGENVHAMDLGPGGDEPLRMREPNPVDFRLPHISAHDPSLAVSSGHLNIDDPGASLSGLPTYTSNASSNFDFALMEQFAVEEKTTLGISSPVESFGAHFRRRNTANAGGEPTSNGMSNQAVAGPSEVTITLPRSSPQRHRKLSQSNSNPRARKGIGGKMALFEGNPGEPPPSLPSRLMTVAGPGGTLSAVPSTDSMAATAAAARPPGFSSEPDLRPLPANGGIPGILQTGHDRPYRFSFYSNALSATIHARSLSELPADGQSFEDLFNGTLPGQDSAPGGMPTPAAAPPFSKFADTTRRAGDARPTSTASNPYFGRDTKGPPADYSRNSRAMVGGGDFEGNTWWLDVQSPTDDEMKMLSKVFSIHPLTTEDIQMEETREKIELFRNYYLVCFRSFDQDPYSPTHLEPLNMYIIVFREGTLSFHFRPTPHPQNVRRRIKQLKDYISVTSDWISYALIDDITDAFGPLIQSIEYEVDSIDELVLILKDAEQSDMLRRIGTCRKKVMGLLRLMGNKADVVKGLAKRCNENWRVAPTSDIGLYLSDIQDHLITMTQNLNHYEKILSRSHSNYLAQISIEMTDANNQINDVLSKLTALGTVLIPMNLITGLWGMNVHVPGQDV
ncbi:cora-domain-containing protein [Athelia psychrophila]|uniref:Cora-domain-containing protein n=1 Tax=Athelia psychrophila TaxID=1759441 RepID=A0A166IS53_9AGAM|nr:cora-domain-containing protein [Fibularhizoctonia sp. CBS 109695]